MLDVEEQLHRYARAAGDSVPKGDPASHTRRRPRAVMILAAAAIIAVLSGAVLVATRGESDDVVTVGPADASGSWDTLPAAPLSGRTGEIAVATDDELIIWGGTGTDDERYNDGAAYSFDTGTWRTLAPSPLSPRSNALAVWTGTEVVIWGGGLGAGQALADDGATYDPSSDTWRQLTTSGIRGRSDSATAVWTGQEVVLVGVEVDADTFLNTAPSDVPGLDGNTDAVAFDPGPIRVRPLERLPESGIGVRHAVWSGDEVLLTSTTVVGAGLRVDALNLETGTWTERLATTVPGLETTADAVWTGDRLALIGEVTAGLLIDPVSGDTTPLAAAGVTAYAHQFPSVLLDGGIVSVGDRWLDVATKTWHDTAPIPDPERFAPVAVTHDGKLYVWGGSSCQPGTTCDPPFVDNTGLIWTPSSEKKSP